MGAGLSRSTQESVEPIESCAGVVDDRRQRERAAGPPLGRRQLRWRPESAHQRVAQLSGAPQAIHWRIASRSAAEGCAPLDGGIEQSLTFDSTLDARLESDA